MATTTTLTGIAIEGQRAFGVFVSQLMSGSSLGLAAMGLAFALGQQAIRTVQPLMGELAERAGAHRLVIGDAVLCVLATLLSTSWGYVPITLQ